MDNLQKTIQSNHSRRLFMKTYKGQLFWGMSLRLFFLWGKLTIIMWLSFTYMHIDITMNLTAMNSLIYMFHWSMIEEGC